MRDPVEITARGIAHSAALDRYVGEQALELDRVCGRVLSCHVTAEALHRQGRQDTQFAVRLEITLPGTEVVVNREHGEDVYIALRDAFAAASLQLKDYLRQLGSAGRRSNKGKENRGTRGSRG